MREIIGNTTATPTPRSDWAQTDANKVDFIKNKPELGALATKDEIAKTDLAADVRASLDKANSAIQSVDDKVDKIDGKGLSTNDYTTVEKEKLARIAEDANNYVHPETHPADMITGLSKVATSGSYTDLTNIPATFEPSAHTHDYIPTSQKGSANGVAELDSNGKVSSAQLPSYVDDVIEYSTKASFPATGETGKIYIDTTTNITYRWGGSTYVPIGSDLALGETSSTAYYGDKGKAAYEHSQIKSGNPHGLKYDDLLNKPTIPSINGLASEDYVDGKIAAIPTPDVSGQINAHNTNTSAHADIREEISQLSSEIVDEITNRENAIIDVKAQIIQQTPLFANSIEECTDTSKVYVLPDGYIYAYVKTTVTTEGGKVPNFTNLLDRDDAVIKPNARYSLSSDTWKSGTDEQGGTGYVISIPRGTVTLRIKNYYWHNYTYLYGGKTNDNFDESLGDTSTGSAFLATLAEKDKEITLTFTNDLCDYATFFSKTGYVEIVTANEEITYTTTEGGTVTTYQWTNTGRAFVPADYENRIVELEYADEEHNIKISEIERITEEHRLKISELEAGNDVSQQSIEFVESVADFTDTNQLYVLPDGDIYKYDAVDTNALVPAFTNLMDEPDAYIRDGERYSYSGEGFTSNPPDCAIVVPLKKKSSTYTFRTRGGSYQGCEHPNSIYLGASNTYFDTAPDGGSTNLKYGIDANGDTYVTLLEVPSGDYTYAVFHIASGVDKNSLIVTVNEEIEYTTGKDYTRYEWQKSGYSFVTNALEEDIAKLKSDIESEQDKTHNSGVFATPAYAPTPQLPADGSEGSDFDYKTLTTQGAYDYMDALCNKYTQYITKQTMGKDASGDFNHNRYILSKVYWRAWQKENYPRMYAWKNGSTVIYSVSVSPRVGDTMYSTPYIGTVYSNVTAVNSAEHTASTRTVNGLVFTRNEAGDVEPTLVHTKPPQYPGNFAAANVYKLTGNESTQYTSVSAIGDDYFVGKDGVTYIRYPFDDRKVDKSKPLSIFILSNEHGNYGDDLIPSMVVMRMAKDLCKNTENPFLKWLKENCMITMIPVGNPWGYARYLTSGNTTGYCNSNSVNINRNYDTPGWETSNTDPQGGTKEDGAFGAYPGSEIETQHIMNTMQICKPQVGISMHSPGFAPQYKDMPDNAYFIHQGQGYDSARIYKITEALYSNYGMGGSADIGSAQHYENCGKSPAYIQYVGAVGGLTETVTQENGTNNIYTSIAMEQAYSQMLLFLQTWCEEALEKQK